MKKSQKKLTNDLIEVQQDIHMEKIFDQWMIDYFMSPEGKRRTRNINKNLEELIKDEDKYLV